MNTVNRGWLKKQVEAGKVVMVGAYHFDDCTGADRTANVEMPVRIRKNGEFKEGVCFLYDSDFTGKSGRAYWSRIDGKGIGLVHLRVHSNSNYDLKVLPRRFISIDEAWSNCYPAFQEAIRELAENNGKTWQQVYQWWREYSDSVSGEGGQSALLSEFEKWYAGKLSDQAGSF